MRARISHFTPEGDRLIAPRRILHDHTRGAWDRWSGVTRVRVHTHLCLGAAVVGMGVAVAESRLATADLDAGRLVAIGDFCAFPEGFAANRFKPLSKEARLFVDWLSAALQDA